MTEMQMYCLKCKKKITTDCLLDSKETKKGLKYMYKGHCPDCGTKVCKMTKAPDDQKKN